ncbi:MAG: hypothetical protein FWB84_05300 [Candidatus Bathyarchaeota archaeon]|uniref:IS1634 family transposase n=1 Tax=Candidatus Bathycorpusculum sp. TaxID=2994959 RepID=UPI00281A1E5D|nr:hypothetical protein [Candidatus Termiticorpusculum sp.]
MYISETVNQKYCYICQTTWDKTNKKYKRPSKCIGQLHNNTLIPNKYLTQLLTKQTTNPTTLTNNENLIIKTITNKYGTNIKTKPTKTTPQTLTQQTIQTAQTQFIGPNIVFGAITKRYHIDQLLENAFNPTTAKDILSLSWYLASEGNALNDSDSYLDYYTNPRGSSLSSQDITRLLDTITYDGIMTFYKQWLKEIIKTTKKPDKILYNLTSISYNGENIDSAQPGYNHDHANLPQVNYALLCLRSTAMPLFAWPLNGNITDINTLKTTLQFFQKLKFNPDCLMMDRGFCSISNINAMFENGYTFLQAIRVNANWIYNVIDATESLWFNPDAKIIVGERTFYASTVDCWWVRTKKISGKYVGKEEVLVHVCSGLASRDRYVNVDVGVEVLEQYLCRVFVLFCQDLVGRFHDRFMGRLKVEHDRLVGDEDAVVLVEYEKYLRVYRKKYASHRTVEYVAELIAQHRNKYAGYVCFLSNDLTILSAEDALGEYSTRDYIEKDFDEMKNEVDMARIWVHSDGRMRSRLFISFIAEIYMREIRVCLRNSESCLKLTRKQIFSHIKTIYKVTFKGEYCGEVYPELSRQQREILEALNVKVQG